MDPTQPWALVEVLGQRPLSGQWTTLYHPRNEVSAEKWLWHGWIVFDFARDAWRHKNDLPLEVELLCYSWVVSKQLGILTQPVKRLMKGLLGNQLQHCFPQQFLQAQHAKVLQPCGWFTRFSKPTSPSIFPCLGNVWRIHAPPMLKLFKEPFCNEERLAHGSRSKAWCNCLCRGNSCNDRFKLSSITVKGTPGDGNSGSTMGGPFQLSAMNWTYRVAVSSMGVKKPPSAPFRWVLLVPCFGQERDIAWSSRNESCFWKAFWASMVSCLILQCLTFLTHLTCNLSIRWYWAKCHHLGNKVVRNWA